MINLYAAEIKTNEMGEKYVDNYVPFVIPKVLNWNLEYYDNNLKYYKNARVYATKTSTQNNIDVLPTFLDALALSVFDVISLNVNDLKGRTINFFESQTMDSIVNFSLTILDSSIYDPVMGFFGDIEHGVGITTRLQDRCVLINRNYNETTFQEMSDHLRTTEENLFIDNENYRQYAFYPEYCPLNVFRYEVNYGMYLEFQELYQKNRHYYNLSRWSGWNLMLTGNQWYGNAFSLDLEEEVKGIEKIELGNTLLPFKAEFDEGFAYEMTATIQEKGAISRIANGFSFFNPGTDLTRLFDFTKYGETQDVRLANGSRIILRIWGDINNLKCEFSIKLQDEGVCFYIGSLNISSINYKGDSSLKGLYLCVHPDYAQVAASSWKTMIAEDIDYFEYGNNPFFLVSWCGEKLQTNYWNQGGGVIPQTTYEPGWCCNYVSTSINNFNDESLPISIDFFLKFLEGFEPKREHPTIGGGSLGGGYSGGRGGQGGFDDSSFVGDVGTLIHSTLDTRIPLMNNMYSLKSIDLVSLFQKMWETDWASEKKLFGNNENPSDCITSIKYMPITIDKVENVHGVINCGGLTLNCTDTGSFYSCRDSKFHDFGTLTIDEYFGSYLDYSETRIALMLPYVGVVDLPTERIMGSKINLSANIDCVDGTIVYYLTLDKNKVKNVIDTYSGNIAFDLPISARDMDARRNEIGKGTIQTLVSTVGGAISGGVAGAAMAGVSGLVNTLNNSINTLPSITKGGSFAGQRFSISTPYLIITRPKQITPETYAQTYGFPSNISSMMSDLKGFSVIKETHLENMGDATKGEIDEIETLLKAGVIF